MSRKKKPSRPGPRAPAPVPRKSWRGWYAAKRPLLLYSGTFVGVMLVLGLASLTVAYQRAVAAIVTFDAYAAQILLQLLGETPVLSGATLRSGTTAIITVESGCTGLGYSWFLIAAIAAFPAALSRKLPGILLGVAAVLLLNTLRVASLYWVGVHAPEHFDFVHEQLWAVLLNFTTLGLLVAWLAWNKASPVL